MPFIMWHSGVGGVGGVSPDSCLPSALIQLQSCRCNSAQRIRWSRAAEWSKKWGGQNPSQLEGHPNVFSPKTLCPSGVSGLLVQCHVQIQSQRWTSCHHLGVIMPFPSLFPVVSPQRSSTEICSFFVGSAPMACSGSKPPLLPPM